MSNAIRYDSLLVRYLATELNARLAGRPVEALRIDPERRRVALVFDDEALVWDLHPTAGQVTLGPAPSLPEPVPLARRTRVGAVTAPIDERIIAIDLATPARRPGRAARLYVELLGNQWNLVAVDPHGRIVEVAWRRGAGRRTLRPGQRYEPPPPSTRRGAAAPLTAAEWRELLAPVPPGDRAARAIAEIAYISPINVEALLGAAMESVDDVALEAAYDRYAALASLPPAEPRLLLPERRRQPYPLPLPGVDDQPAPSLLAAMASAAGPTAVAPGPVVSVDLMDRLRSRIARLEKRRDRLKSELTGAAGEAATLRRQADLLLSQIHRVRKGMNHVSISDFAGGSVEVALDPALTPVENAHRLYELAKRRDRAAERLPALVSRVESEVARLGELRSHAERGAAGAEEIAGALGEAAPARRGRAAEPRLLPYRSYRTTGGLEVRIGRSSRSNDDLTFHHSAPNDIWLHARDVAGAHVILRWGDGQSNPPGRDLAEAAVLAALHSRARTSGTVAVDWTRRKYVRKPRKSPPGVVTMERGRTLFVEPDEAVERRLRIGDG